MQRDIANATASALMHAEQFGNWTSCLGRSYNLSMASHNHNNK